MKHAMAILGSAVAFAALAGCSGNDESADTVERIEQREEATAGSAVVGQEAITVGLQCGAQPIRATIQGEQLQLEIGDRLLPLAQAVSASGARYVSAGEQPQTTLWFKGEVASFEHLGREYPLCTPIGAIVEPWQASGNEPFWQLRMEQGQLVLNRLNEGESPAQAYAAAAPGVYEARGEPVVSVQVSDELCRDSMTGMPRPQQVSVQLQEATLQGCGGDPARLLQGVEWVVEDINEAGMIDRSRVTVSFGVDGRVYGRASCNGFFGQYRLTGEGLRLAQLANTLMACAPTLMEQEQRVLKTLEAVQGFDFDETGALLLRSAEGSLKARPEQPVEG